MACAEPAFFTPLLWPVAHLARMFTVTEADKPITPKAEATLGINGHLTTFAGAIRSFLMGYACIYYLYDNDSINECDKYPAFRTENGISFNNINDFNWVFTIIIRNLIFTMLICGFWDYILYFSPLAKKLEKFKYTKEYPSSEQIKHDIFYTLLSSIFAGIIESILSYLWANGFIYYQKDLFETPISNLLWIITTIHWRIPHFYLIHRMMHPWKLTGKWAQYDFGKTLYKHVHSLHHKSYNPTAFSGTNMHPVEGTLYYTAALICIPFGCHPSIALGCIVDCAVGAWLGHDGFQWPGSGDYFHQLHHLHFDCNYGNPHIPFDKLFGTFISCKDDLKIIWKKKNVDVNTVGRTANEKVCKVHPTKKIKD